MNRKEIYKELQMSYDELHSYLIKKYGGAVCDYFATPECKSKNKKVSRTNEGLYCHHIDEDKGGNLSDSISAIRQPFEWQKKERLVYCNALEHLILHFKIAVLRQKEEFIKPNDISKFFTTGGIFMICKELNDMFMEDGTSVAWKKRCYQEVRDNYADYIILVNILLKYIDNDYCAEKNEPALLVPGSIVHFTDGDCTILKVTRKRDVFLLKMPNGDEKPFPSDIAKSQFRYIDEVELAIRGMSSGYKEFYEKIRNDIVSCDKNEDVSKYAKMLKVDYKGYGFAQFSNIKLTEDFGSKMPMNILLKAYQCIVIQIMCLMERQLNFGKGQMFL